MVHDLHEGRLFGVEQGVDHCKRHSSQAKVSNVDTFLKVVSLAAPPSATRVKRRKKAHRGVGRSFQ